MSSENRPERFVRVVRETSRWLALVGALTVGTVGIVGESEATPPAPSRGPGSMIPIPWPGQDYPGRVEIPVPHKTEVEARGGCLPLKGQIGPGIRMEKTVC